MAHTYQTLQDAVLLAYADNASLPRMTIVSACYVNGQSVTTSP